MPTKPREERRPFLAGLDLTAVAAGVVVSFALTFVASTIMALLLYNMIMSDNRLPLLEDLAGLISVVLGGWYAARRAETSGWLHGGVTGVVYVLIALTLGLALYSVPFILVTSLKRLGAGFLLGALGGVLGVNLRR
ncbi:MAG: TIGR04086 family membrane protein [Firmicutes bacterium]|nr:TIGR04086 family membrane protein [Bacillota bacterium]MCL5038332.1 TIGR04086 family membrane protein [Bacillota bacterium]